MKNIESDEVKDLFSNEESLKDFIAFYSFLLKEQENIDTPECRKILNAMGWSDEVWNLLTQ